MKRLFNQREALILFYSIWQTAAFGTTVFRNRILVANKQIRGSERTKAEIMHCTIHKKNKQVSGEENRTLLHHVCVIAIQTFIYKRRTKTCLLVLQEKTKK